MAYFNIFQKKWLDWSPVEPLDVPVEPRSDAVEHVAVGGAKNTKVRKLMGALWIPVSLVLGYSEQFSELL